MMNGVGVQFAFVTEALQKNDKTQKHLQVILN